MPHDTKKGKAAVAALRHAEREHKRESGKGLGSGIHEGSQAGRKKAGKPKSGNVGVGRGGPGRKPRDVMTAAEKRGTLNPVARAKRRKAEGKRDDRLG